MNWRRLRRNKGNSAFIDYLFNKAFWFVILFILAFVLVNPITKKADVKSKAELIVTIDWPEGDNDIDLWCQDPQDRIVWYNSQDVGFMHLDRDDLGDTNDTIEVDGRVVIVLINREILAIRGILPGEYVCNVHYFRSAASKNTKPGQVGTKPGKPVLVKMRIQKLNPEVKLVFKGETTLMKEKQEKTMVRFTLDENGEVSKVETTPPKKLIGGRGEGDHAR